MSVLFDASGYKSIIRIKKAYLFDSGALLIRMFLYMLSAGVVSMMTLSGISFTDAGMVTSVIALSFFVLGPQIARLVDRKGQCKVIAVCIPIALLGLCLLLHAALGVIPFVFAYIGAVLLGFIPTAQALTRARWTYLVESGKLGDSAPDLKTVYSYEGVLDDIAFMVAPAAAVSLSVWIAPIAGLCIGGVLFVIGSILMACARSTDIPSNWDKRNKIKAQKGLLIFRNPIILILFFAMFFVGIAFGIFDIASLAFAENIGNPQCASVALVLQAIFSGLAGFAFGMTKFSGSRRKRLIVCGVLIGVGYSLMIFINSVPMLFFVACFASLYYAPFVITVNEVCERVVSGNNITEGIAWVSAGASCGIAIGPALCGWLVDQLGTSSSFLIGGIFALMVPLIMFICWKYVRKRKIVFE